MRKSLKLLPQHLISLEDDLYQRITRLLLSGEVSNLAEEKEFHIEETHLDQIRSLRDLAVPDVSSVDGEKSVVGLDPPVQGRDGVLQDLHDEDARLRTAPTDPDPEMFARLSLQADGEEVLVVRQGADGAPRPPVLLYPLPVHPQPQDARHLPQGRAHLEHGNIAQFYPLLCVHLGNGNLHHFSLRVH